MTTARTYPDVDALLATAEGLDRGALLRLAARPEEPEELESARYRALLLIRRRGLEADLAAVSDRIVDWSFAGDARMLSWSVVPPVYGGVPVADARSEAVAALRDAVIATILGQALDRADADLLLAAWRDVTESEPA